MSAPVSIKTGLELPSQARIDLPFRRDVARKRPFHISIQGSCRTQTVRSAKTSFIPGFPIVETRIQSFSIGRLHVNILAIAKFMKYRRFEVIIKWMTALIMSLAQYNAKTPNRTVKRIAFNVSLTGRGIRYIIQMPKNQLYLRFNKEFPFFPAINGLAVFDA